MPKRKREDTEVNVDRIEDQAVRIKASRLKARFDQGVTQLTSSLKLARGFDRQKMTRRITQAGSDKTKFDRLKGEVEVLNGLQEGKVARKYLLKQCARTKKIAESEGFVALFGGGERVLERLKKDGAVGTVESNVLGRLMKSGPVSEVVPGIMKGIREVLAIDKEKVVITKESENSDGLSQRRSDSDQGGNEEETDFAGFSDREMEAGEDMPRIETKSLDINMFQGSGDDDQIDDGLLERFDDRLANSSDSEAELEDMTNNMHAQDYDRRDDMSITSDSNLSEHSNNISLASSASSDPDTSRIVASQRSQSTTTTSFLPTLMHGGYYSGSDSEDDASGSDRGKSFPSLTNQPPRKNRRGQQERRAIAEKKYGSQAKHLVKANGAERVNSARLGLINSGGRTGANAVGGGGNVAWDAKRGAVEARDRKPRMVREGKPLNRYERRHGGASKGLSRRGGRLAASRGAFGGVNTRDTSTGANADTVAKTRSRITGGEKAAKIQSVSKEKLHPSWEAARKRKIESATIGASSFAGQKITFD